MKLTLVEAAQILRCPARTLRGRAARGEIPANKVGNRWVFERDLLPLTDHDRERIQRRADAVREALERALPSRVAVDRRKRRSVADMAAWRVAREVLAALPAGHTAGAPLQRACHDLARATHRYERSEKGEALRSARDALSVAASELLGVKPPDDAALRLAARLETEALPSIAGLLRWASKAP